MTIIEVSELVQSVVQSTMGPHFTVTAEGLKDTPDPNWQEKFPEPEWWYILVTIRDLAGRFELKQKLLPYMLEHSRAPGLLLSFLARDYRRQMYVHMENHA